LESSTPSRDQNLHAAGYVHCDIHPKNILFNPSTEAVAIIDFGAAVEIGSNGRERSWEYSAPEQWAHEKCTRRADAFAVVGVLIYLLTGCAPFVAEGRGDLTHK
jgi:serine/threonine protein kinase